ncbi:hypothetical protein HK099_002288, partial [Clydaea vesicula]
MAKVQTSMKKSSSNHSNLSQIEVEKVEEDLNSIFTFLNGNLGEITSFLCEDLSLKLVYKVWKRVLVSIEGLLVSDLEEERGVENEEEKDLEIKLWDEKRLSFIKVTVELLITFFQGEEGEGLNKETIQGTKNLIQ